VQALLLAALAGLWGCSVLPLQAPTVPAELLLDARFPVPVGIPPSQAAKDLFRLTPEMETYARDVLQGSAPKGDPRRGLIDALYNRSSLGLSYDDTRTRNAAEAFRDRAGNCLSLVAMTAAFAKRLGMPVIFQQVDVDESYTRRGGLYIVSGHVNLVLARAAVSTLSGLTRRQQDHADLTVDFLPGASLGTQRTRPLAEHSLVAMYLNNRAAELLSEGQGNEAYWWARAAVTEDPAFAGAFNTLGVIYLRSGMAPEAERVLLHVLRAQPENTAALNNMVRTLQALGREEQARVYASRLAALQPQAPFAEFDQGRLAMGRGDYQQARQHFAAELRRQPLQHEVHFWLALAHWHLGELRRSQHHLDKAKDNSPTVATQQRYSAKLQRLRDIRVH